MIPTAFSREGFDIVMTIRLPEGGIEGARLIEAMKRVAGDRYVERRCHRDDAVGYGMGNFDPSGERCVAVLACLAGDGRGEARTHVFPGSEYDRVIVVWSPELMVDEDGDRLLGGIRDEDYALGGVRAFRGALAVELGVAAS